MHRWKLYENLQDLGASPSRYKTKLNFAYSNSRCYCTEVFGIFQIDNIFLQNIVLGQERKYCQIFDSWICISVAIRFTFCVSDLIWQFDVKTISKYTIHHIARKMSLIDFKRSSLQRRALINLCFVVCCCLFVVFSHFAK